MDCIDLFKRAAMALQTDSRYLAMDQARKMNDKDEELQNLIGEFNLARMDLNNEIGKSERSDALMGTTYKIALGFELFRSGISGMGMHCGIPSNCFVKRY